MKAQGIIVASVLALACAPGSMGRDVASGGAGDGDGGDGGSSQTAGTGGSGHAGSGTGAKGGVAAAGGAAGTAGGSGGAGSGGSAAQAGEGGGQAGAAAQGGSAGAVAAMGCVPMPVGIIRDFNDNHPDFGFAYTSGTQPALPVDLVKADLDADDKPAYGLPGPLLASDGLKLFNSAASFAQWWRPRGKQLNATTMMQAESQMEITPPVVDLLNNTYRIGLAATWWPIDGMLLGNIDNFVAANQAQDDVTHNALWTLEMVFEIEYQGLDIEVMVLASDDDGFMFVNRKLALNNGLLHGPVGASIRLKDRAAELGLVVGQTYPVHVFQAERYIAGTLNIVTRNIKFVNCGKTRPKLP